MNGSTAGGSDAYWYPPRLAKGARRATTYATHHRFVGSGRALHSSGADPDPGPWALNPWKNCTAMSDGRQKVSSPSDGLETM